MDTEGRKNCPPLHQQCSCDVQMLGTRFSTSNHCSASPSPPTSWHTHAHTCTPMPWLTLTPPCSPLPSGCDMATYGFPRTHVGWSCGRITEKNWSPTGPGCPSPVSLDLARCFRLRLAAEEAALGLESTRLHVLPVSICFPWKPTGLGCQASLRAHSSQLCSLSLWLHLLLHQLLAQFS